ncbi:MAG: hypothetical protein R2861_02280 [Desulfobacterales bacterium]
MTSLKDKIHMAQMTQADLDYLHPSLGMLLKIIFKMGNENDTDASCREPEDRGVERDGRCALL